MIKRLLAAGVVSAASVAFLTVPAHASTYTDPQCNHWPGVYLSDGSTGPLVTEWQQEMQSWGYAIRDDGVYGDYTGDATLVVQQQTGQTQDEVVGPHTWNAAFCADPHNGPYIILNT